ncbi:glycosyltransferase [Entomobacter blattae]|uniref:D-inositol-3-phosphate glycosyltransferase n=1 Tax=Entomobacter blattae TaxID=2762277 RepID=A0A7H1NSR6_9PROT|nr:glycosyltransferase [Entomobacter blattae]QNT78826.1 D-inositol-3-phosphate glycosyltransferase [Entomobacter blattae]
MTFEPRYPLSSLRVVHVMAGAETGGAELFFERLVVAQHNVGVNVFPIIRKNEKRSARLQEKGLNPLELNFGGYLDMRTGICLKDSLKKFQPHVVVAWMNRAARFIPRGEWKTVGRLGGFYSLNYYKNCLHLVGNTHGIVEWIKQQNWPAENVHYLPNFVDSVTSHGERPPFLPLGVPFVLALGRFHTNKAFDVLLRAVALCSTLHVVIAGDGPERSTLEAMVEQLKLQGRVHMPGWIEQPGRWIAACDVLVCPSRHEPLGNVIIEGFAAKKPVVAAASEGPVELIVHNVNGLLAPLENAEALAIAIQDVLGDKTLSERLASAGYRTYQTQFAIAPVVTLWNNFLMQFFKE